MDESHKESVKDENLENDWVDVAGEVDNLGDQMKPVLSINPVQCSQGLQTIKLLGYHKNRQLVILIDSGSTNSEIKLSLVDTPVTTNTVADGRK